MPVLCCGVGQSCAVPGSRLLEGPREAVVAVVPAAWVSGGTGLCRLVPCHHGATLCRGQYHAGASRGGSAACLVLGTGEDGSGSARSGASASGGVPAGGRMMEDPAAPAPAPPWALARVPAVQSVWEQSHCVLLRTAVVPTRVRGACQASGGPPALRCPGLSALGRVPPLQPPEAASQRPHVHRHRDTRGSDRRGPWGTRSPGLQHMSCPHLVGLQKPPLPPLCPPAPPPHCRPTAGEGDSHHPAIPLCTRGSPGLSWRDTGRPRHREPLRAPAPFASPCPAVGDVLGGSMWC